MAWYRTGQTRQPGVTSERTIRPMAHGDLHARVLPHLMRALPPSAGGPAGATEPQVLDLGAGTGSMCQLMQQAGYGVAACDLAPELFELPDVECRRADFARPLPYEDAAFDGLVCLEVLEHVDGHLPLFQEICRVLKPGGWFIFSTPNVMSIKSRLSFLQTGFAHSFYPLECGTQTPQEWHISGFGPNRYRFMLRHAGLDLEHVTCDKLSRNSLAWAWLVPWMKLRSRLRYGRAPGAVLNNSLPVLLGRSLVGVARRPLTASHMQLATQTDRPAA